MYLRIYKILRFLAIYLLKWLLIYLAIHMIVAVQRFHIRLGNMLNCTCPPLFLDLASHSFSFFEFQQVEIKNMNSFSAINRAIDYEISRQILLHKEGQADQIVQETRLWDESSQVA